MAASATPRTVRASSSAASGGRGYAGPKSHCEVELDDHYLIALAKQGKKALPGIVSDLAGATDWLFQTTGTYIKKIHVLSEMNKTIACSIDKAVRVLGYDPTVELEEGMRRSIRWCLDRGLIRA